MDFYMVHLRLKDNWQFSLNDAYVESFMSLPCIEQYDPRQKELLKYMKDEVDLVNNLNIISIFANGGSSPEYKLNLEAALMDFSMLYDSDGQTPFCRCL